MSRWKKQLKKEIKDKGKIGDGLKHVWTFAEDEFDHSLRFMHAVM